MALDQVGNFKKVIVSTGYDSVATSIALQAGEGAELPDPAGANYNLVWWNSTTYTDPADDPNVEIVRVTAKSTDTLTVTRGQEGISATTKNTGGATYKMLLGPTAKIITDIETSLTYKKVTQSSHGFAVGDWLYFDGADFVKAKADAVATSEVVGCIREVPDTDNFTLQFIGHITGLSGLAAGTVYFLSNITAGAITATEPTTEDHISKPVLVADSGSSGYMFNWRGVQIVSGNGIYGKTFINGDLVSSVLTVSHSLDYQYPGVFVIDNDDKLMGSVDSITYTDADNLDIDLSSQSPITGTWRVLIIGASTGNVGKYIADADGDTVVHTEESADEDVVRIDVGGSEVVSITDNDATFTTAGSNLNFTIDSSSNGSARLILDSQDDGGEFSEIHFRAGGGHEAKIYSTNSTDLVFDTGGTDRVEINSNGTLTVTQATNNICLDIDNDGTNHGIYIHQDGVNAAGDHGLYVLEAAVQTNASTVQFESGQATLNQYLVNTRVTNGSNTGGAMQIYNVGTGRGLFINQDGAGVGLHIDQDGAQSALEVNQATGYNCLSISHHTTPFLGTAHGIFCQTTTAVVASDAALVKLVMSSGSATEPVIEINNQGSGADIESTTDLTLLDSNTGPLTLSELATSAIEFVIDGGGSAITTGIKGDLEIPFACTIQQVTLLADQSTTTTIDIWKDTYANFPPTDADSITAAAVPGIVAGLKDQDATLTGWTTAVTAGDILRFNVDANDNATRVTIALKVVKV